MDDGFAQFGIIQEDLAETADQVGAQENQRLSEIPSILNGQGLQETAFGREQ